ncbi:MAG: DMT family transporter [Eubacteriales bacterium]|nr:DMT family transporter [Eubacteriales bacterium]
MKHTELKNLLLLFLTAMIWGAAFVAQSAGMDYVGPFTFLSARSFLGGIFLLPCIRFLDKLNTVDNTPRKADCRSNRKQLLLGGSCAGLVLMLASSLQQIGILYTTVGKAGFLTAMYVIIVPFLGVFLLHQKLEKRIWVCVLLAVCGMALLCLNGSARLQLGDALELLCALAFSIHILVLDHFTSKVDPVRLSCIQFFVCGIFSAIPMLLLEHPTIHVLLAAWLPIAYAGILSSGVAYTLQAIAQKKCDPTLASLVMCLESVFSAVFGWLILHQALSLREGIGCILMFAAIVLANLPGKKHDTAISQNQKTYQHKERKNI